MEQDFHLTPHQIGYAIGMSMRQIPILDQVNDEELQHLTVASISSSDFLNERYLICASAAICTIRQTLQRSNLMTEVLAGYHQFLQTTENPTRLSFLMESIEEASQYYQEAADDDGELEWAEPGKLSEIELAFGDRLFNLTPETESKELARAYLSLSFVGPRLIWNLQSRMAREMLIDAKPILLN